MCLTSFFYQEVRRQMQMFSAICVSGYDWPKHTEEESSIVVF
jgi:hypothetical protein